jgi:hypothetical protein
MTGTTALGTVVAEHIAAVNAFDEDAIVATFAYDALLLPSSDGRFNSSGWLRRRQGRYPGRQAGLSR